MPRTSDLPIPSALSGDLALFQVAVEAPPIQRSKQKIHQPQIARKVHGTQINTDSKTSAAWGS